MDEEEIREFRSTIRELSTDEDNSEAIIDEIIKFFNKIEKTYNDYGLSFSQKLDTKINSLEEVKGWIVQVSRNIFKVIMKHEIDKTDDEEEKKNIIIEFLINGIGSEEYLKQINEDVFRNYVKEKFKQIEYTSRNVNEVISSKLELFDKMKSNLTLNISFYVNILIEEINKIKSITTRIKIVKKAINSGYPEYELMSLFKDENILKDIETTFKIIDDNRRLDFPHKVKSKINVLKEFSDFLKKNLGSFKDVIINEIKLTEGIENKLTFINIASNEGINTNITITDLLKDTELDFLSYYNLKDKIPVIKQYSKNITKKSILEFLYKAEATDEEIEQWNELHKSQYGEDEEPTPPPEWWLLSTRADVHHKGHIRITDCRIKLLLEKHTSRDIEKIAYEIEKETARRAKEVATEDKIQNIIEYVKNNTIKQKTILTCRTGKKERYYGYGGIFDQHEAEKLDVDKRVEICEVVIKIWEVIQLTKDNKEMYNTLLAQFVGAFKEHIADGVCNQGWVGGLTSIFGSYAKELGYLCMTDKEQQIHDFASKLLIDMRDDIEVPYPTISKLFIEISNILLDAKYDDEWEEKEHTEEENKSFREKIRMYDILYEDPTVPKDIKMQTMKKFIDCMLPTFFMRCVDYFEKEKLTRIKEAVKFSLEEFKRFQLEKICGKIK